jgi:topoisomerase-4 subunit B
LPLRGKILNVASAGQDKMDANREIGDILLALGCGSGDSYREDDLRYEKVIIMTDADVDGAHIASLLMTYFYRQMPGLVRDGHLYLALPPLYRITQGAKTIYAKDDAHKDRLMATEFTGRVNIEISRFKGLGEMPAAQLKETTMSPSKRTLLRVMIPEGRIPQTAELVEHLMGRKPELRLAYIQEHAPEATDLDI